MAPSAFAFVGAALAVRITRTSLPDSQHAAPTCHTNAFLGARVAPRSARAVVTAPVVHVTTVMVEKKASKTLRDTPIEDVRNVGIVA
jgi:hypothetical protein